MSDLLDSREQFVGHLVRVQAGYGIDNRHTGRLYKMNGGLWLDHKDGELLIESRIDSIQHLPKRCALCKSERLR